MRPQATSRTIARVRLRCSQASRILHVVVGPEDASAWRLGVEGRTCACGAGASPSAAKRGGGSARRPCDAGRRGLPSRSRVPRSAAACGLRATSLGARRPGLRRKIAAEQACTAARRAAPLMLLGPAARGNPGRLRASPLPRSRDGNPRHPALQRLLALEKGQKNALAQASVTFRHVSRLRVLSEAPVRAIVVSQRDSYAHRVRWNRSPARAHSFVFPFAKRGVAERGGWGFLSRDLGSGEARR